MASALIGNLAVSLTMSTAAFQRGATLAEKRTEQMRGRFAAATTSVKGLGAALGVTLGADILYNIAAGAFQMASGLQEASEQVGVTVEGLQELRFAAEQTGVGTDKIEAAMKRLNRSLGDLQRGKSATVKAFAEIGLSADELRGKRPDEALRLIADALNKIPDASQRVAIGQQLMGRSFSDLLPLINGGSAALDEFAERSRENGQISDEDAAKLDALADRWGEFKTQVSVATANIIADIIPMAQAIGNFLDNTRAFFAKVHDATTISVAGIKTAISELVNFVGDWIGRKLDAIWDRAIAKIQAVERWFDWLTDKVVRNSHVPEMVHKIGVSMMTLDRTMVGQAESVTGAVNKSFEQMANGVVSSLSRLQGSIKSGGFLGILEAVVGLGFQLGGLGLFGGKIAANINNPGGFGGAKNYVAPPRSNGGGATIQVVPSPLFEVVVDTRAAGTVAAMTPGIQRGTMAQAAFRQSRRLA